MRKVYDLAGLACASALLTREQGSKVRQLILDGLGSSGTAELDLTSVTVMSPSFADELLGGLEREMGKPFVNRIRIRGATPETKRLIQKALAYRRSVGR